MPHPDEGTIHAWLDGALPAGEAAALESHVAGCAACAAAVAEARGFIAASSRILSALDAVPAGVVPASAQPAGDVVPAATEPVRDGGVTPIRAPLRTSRWRVGPLRAAAAVLLMVGGAAVVFRSSDRGEAAFDLSTPAIEQTTTLDSSLPTTGGGSAAPAPIAATASTASTATESATPTRQANAAAPREEPQSGAVADLASPPPPAVARGSAGRDAALGAAAAAPPASPLTVAPPSAASVLADRDGAARRTAGRAVEQRAVEERAAESEKRVMSAEAPAPVAPQAPGAALDVAESALAQAPLPDDEAAPMIRSVAGWTVLGSAVVRDPASLARRTTYRLATGAQVTLEEAVPRDTVSISARSRARQEAREVGGADLGAVVGRAAGKATQAEPSGTMRTRDAPRAATSATAPQAVPAVELRVNLLRWEGEDGRTFSISGAVDVRTLEALREELRRSASAPRP